MNRAFAVLVLASLWPAFLRAEPAKPSPTPATRAPSGPATYDSFRLIHTRNVFDPDRRPLRPASSTPPPAASNRPDYAALTGTMLSPEKTYAFFSGSRPAFNKVLSVRDQFANATIAAITGQSIEIERDGKRTTVLIGQTVPFDNQTAPGEPPADPSPTDSPTPAATPGTAAGTTAGPARPIAAGASSYAAPAAKGTPANVDEIRRRMMEKRQQELK